MDKTFLEKRIKERAIERFEEDYRDFVDAIIRNPVGNLLKIRVEEKQIPLSNSGPNYGVFNKEQDENSWSKYTNYSEVKEYMVNEYVERETDEIINKLESIGHLFNK